MTRFSSIRTFAAANSAQGFVSLFDGITGQYQTTVIKGGPGTGKSSLMKQVAKKAAERNIPVEYIYCSSDSDSLDGVLLEERRRLICDGTPPHTVEPCFPGVKDTILNLGECWREAVLRKNKEEIVSLSRRASALYRPAYSFLKAAGEARLAVRELAQPFLETEALERYTDGLIHRLICDGAAENAAPNYRFLSAYSHKGFVTFRDTVYESADRVYSFYDRYESAPKLMQRLFEAAVNKGHSVYVFYDPLLPQEIAHILLPDLRLAFVTSNASLAFDAQNAPHVSLSRFFANDILSVRGKISFARRAEKMCIREALSYISQAKKVHDDLEEYYISAMDFDRVRALGEKTAEEMVTQ